MRKLSPEEAWDRSRYRKPKRLCPAIMRRRESRLEGRAWLAFACPGCGAPPVACSRRRKDGPLPGPGGDLDVVLLETAVTLPEPVTADRPHWCYPPDGAFCEG